MLRRGFRDNQGDVAYFLPSFVEDPWNRNALVRTEHEEVTGVEAAEDGVKVEEGSTTHIHEVIKKEEEQVDDVAFTVASAVEDPWNREE